ncbi:hypothetical protein Aph02nite_89750 [Actinoplanes philippinensis]|nr:hypothetical protein Aph02nite_89750 [Actinoplanes philippinensis]
MTALALLIINDHLLKSAWPGWVTGKLSDAAGMVLAPPLLAALTGLLAPRLPFRRLAIAAIVTVGAGFLVVKLWGYGAQLASAAWSLITPSLVRADPSDLMACPFLSLAWWTADRPLGVVPARRWMRALRLAVMLPAALFGVAATSNSSPGPARADAVAVGADGAIYLNYQDGPEPDAVSRDGGRTWQHLDEPSPVRSASPAGSVSPCSRSVPVVCYRVVPGQLAVQSDTGDARWPDSWRIDGPQREALLHEHGTDRLASVMLTVADVPGGHVVVVANGLDGFAMRDVDGLWTRIGFPGGRATAASPAPAPPAAAIPAPVEAGDYTGVSIGILFGGLSVTAFLIRRLGKGWGWLFAPQVAAAGLMLTDPGSGVVAVGILAVVATCVVIAYAAGERSRPRVRRR